VLCALYNEKRHRLQALAVHLNNLFKRNNQEPVSSHASPSSTDENLFPSAERRRCLQCLWRVSPNRKPWAPLPSQPA